MTTFKKLETAYRAYELSIISSKFTKEERNNYKQRLVSAYLEFGNELAEIEENKAAAQGY